MRFRKIRSLLSAYSNDELDAVQKESVREQLAQDETLKREALGFQKIKDGCRQLTEFEPSDDFNARLLNRIAQERFAETRTKAYLPSRIPGLWRRVAVPVMTTMAIALFGVVGYSTWQTLPQASALTAESGEGQLGGDDSYLYASSANNPNAQLRVKGDRTLSGLMAKVDRADKISSWMTSGARHVTNNQLAGQRRFSGNNRLCPIPYSIQFYRVRPIITNKPLVPRTRGEEKTY